MKRKLPQHWHLPGSQDPQPAQAAGPRVRTRAAERAVYQLHHRKRRTMAPFAHVAFCARNP